MEDSRLAEEKKTKKTRSTIKTGIHRNHERILSLCICHAKVSGCSPKKVRMSCPSKEHGHNELEKEKDDENYESFRRSKFGSPFSSLPLLGLQLGVDWSSRKISAALRRFLCAIIMYHHMFSQQKHPAAVQFGYHFHYVSLLSAYISKSNINTYKFITEHRKLGVGR